MPSNNLTENNFQGSMQTVGIKRNKDPVFKGLGSQQRRTRDIRGGGAVSLTEGSHLPPLEGRTHSLPGSVTLKVREQRRRSAGV